MMFNDIDRLMKQVARTSQQLIRLFEDVWGQGPKVDVQNLGKSVKLIVETPPNQNVRQWSVRAWEDIIYLRGVYTTEYSIQNDLGGVHHERKTDEFVKAVPVPYPVESKPYSVKKDGGKVTLIFTKQKQLPAQDWYHLDI